MVEELEQLAQCVNNRSARGANLEVRLRAHLRLSLHLATQCTFAAQLVPCDLARSHLCQLDFACALSEHMPAQRAHAGLAHGQYKKHTIVLRFKGKRREKSRGFFWGTKIRSQGTREGREPIHLGTLSSIFFHTSCFLFVLVSLS